MSSSSSKSPAFQFYPHDFLAGRVATYPMEARGVYITLLSFDWTLDGLPTDEFSLARLCGISSRKFAAIWPTIADQFPVVQGDGKPRRFNPRLQLEREKQAAWREKSAKGGRAKAAKGGTTVVVPPLVPNGCTPSPSPTPVTTKKKNPVVADAPTGEPGAESAPPDQPPFRLAPYLDVHREIRGESVPPAAKWAKAFKALERKFGAEAVLTRWRRCLVAKGEFATPQWLGANWGDYAEDAPAKGGEKSPLQELEELGAQDSWWTEGLEAARRKRAA